MLRLGSGDIWPAQSGLIAVVRATSARNVSPFGEVQLGSSTGFV